MNEVQYQNLSARFRVETVLLFASSLLNMLVILTIGFLIGPQITNTYTISRDNYEMSVDNNKILQRINTLLDKSEQRMKSKGKNQ